MKQTSNAANTLFNLMDYKRAQKDAVPWVAARLKSARNFKQGPNKPQPELDCRFLSQHFHLLSSPSYPHRFYGSIGVTCGSSRPGGGAAGAASREHGGVLLGRGGCELPAPLQTCLPSSQHRHRLSQRAAAATATASRDFNELAAVLQPTYLPPAAPPSLCQSLPSPLPSWLLQAAGRGREELFIVCLLKMKGFYILMSTK